MSQTRGIWTCFFHFDGTKLLNHQWISEIAYATPIEVWHIVLELCSEYDLHVHSHRHHEVTNHESNLSCSKDCKVNRIAL